METIFNLLTPCCHLNCFPLYTQNIQTKTNLCTHAGRLTSYDQHNHIVGIPHQHTQHRNQQSHLKNFKMLTKFLWKYIVTTRSLSWWSWLSKQCRTNPAVTTALRHKHTHTPNATHLRHPKKQMSQKTSCVCVCFVGLPTQIYFT